MKIKYQPLSVRFPIDTYHAIKALSEREKRSIVQQILVFVDKGLEADQQNQSA